MLLHGYMGGRSDRYGEDFNAETEEEVATAKNAKSRRKGELARNGRWQINPKFQTPNPKKISNSNSQTNKSMKNFNAKTQRFAETRRGFLFFASLCVPRRLCVKTDCRFGCVFASLRLLR